MCSDKTYPLSLNGDTFNALKSDFDQQLRQLLTEMEKRESEEATINIKIAVSLQPDQARDFQANGYDAMRDIVKPSFKHEVSTVMQVKSKKSGSLGGNFELVWDRELCQYVMREIDNGQVTLFDKEEEPPQPGEPPALPAGDGTVIDAEYREVEAGEGQEGKEDAGGQKDVSGDRQGDAETPFDYLRKFVGAELKVLGGGGYFTVRTSENKVILSSGFNAKDRFYCSEEKLEPHVGHAITCEEWPNAIVIRCDECDEVLFEVDAEGDAAADYPYEDPADPEGEEG